MRRLPKRAYSLGVRISGLRFRVWGLGFRGLGFGIESLGIHVQGQKICLGFRIVFRVRVVASLNRRTPHIRLQKTIMILLLGTPERTANSGKRPHTRFGSSILPYTYDSINPKP